MTSLQQSLDKSYNETTRLCHEKVEYSEVGLCTKYTLFFENFLLLIAGIGMTTLGAYILYIKHKRVYDVIDFFLDPSCILCLVGVITAVICFIGAYGALRENTFFLNIYYFVLCISLLCELTVSVLLFVSYFVPEVKSVVFPTETFKSAIVRYRDDPDMQHLIDSLQSDLGCCGVSDDDSGFMDWNSNIYFNCSIDSESPEKCSVPFSCCIRNEGDNINYRCGANVFKVNSDGVAEPNEANTYLIYKAGCIKALGNWINDHVSIVTGVMLGALFPQIIILFLTKNLIIMINLQKSKW